MDGKALLIGNAPSPFPLKQAPNPLPIQGPATQALSLSGQPQAMQQPVQTQSPTTMTPVQNISLNRYNMGSTGMRSQFSSMPNMQGMQNQPNLMATMPINNIPVPGGISPVRGMGIKGVATSFVPGIKGLR